MSHFVSAASGSVRSTLVLRNLPCTALTSDVRRLLVKRNIENVQDVHLDYHRFVPTGKAFVTFTEPAFAHPALARLRNAQISGMPLDLTLAYPLQNFAGRSRGVKGRDQAMTRGVLDGNGPGGGVRERGKNVVIWGLPGKMATEQLKEVLNDYKLAGTAGGKEEILKLEPEGRPSLTSRHYVRTISASEAHRMVRQLHMTPYSHAGRGYIMRARVVY